MARIMHFITGIERHTNWERKNVNFRIKRKTVCNYLEANFLSNMVLIISAIPDRKEFRLASGCKHTEASSPELSSEDTSLPRCTNLYE